jgi:hypothetical protein
VQRTEPVFERGTLGIGHVQVFLGAPHEDILSRHRPFGIDEIADLGLKPEVRQLFLRDNALRVFGIAD